MSVFEDAIVACDSDLQCARDALERVSGKLLEALSDVCKGDGKPYEIVTLSAYHTTIESAKIIIAREEDQ